MTSSNPSEELRGILLELEKLSVDSINSPKVMEQFKKMYMLDINFLPYSAVTQVVYNRENTDGYSHFLFFYKNMLDNFVKEDQQCEEMCSRDNLCGRCKHVYQVGRKIHEHLTLALQQMDSLYQRHKEEIDNIHTAIKELEKMRDELKDMSSSYISILGIFAAILMGAFGSIQSFASLFDNANSLSMGKLLIIASIGGITVILILHLLLHSVAKMTNRPITSKNGEDISFVQKYPYVFFAIGSMILVLMIGTILEILNIEVSWSLKMLWWLVPICWAGYLLDKLTHKP